MEGIDVGCVNPADCVGQPLHGKDEIEKLLQGPVGVWGAYHLNIVFKSGGREVVAKTFRLNPDDPGVKELAEHGDNFSCSGSSILVKYKKKNSVFRPGYEVEGVAVFLDAGEVGNAIELVHFVTGKASRNFRPTTSQ
jgi:hypothetical protein